MCALKRSLVLVFVLLIAVGCNSRERTPAKKSTESLGATTEQASAKLMQQGVEFLNQKDIAKAVVSFEGAIQVEPRNLQPYMILAEIFMRMQSYPEAIGVLERAVNVFPDNAYVFYMLSLANQGNNTPLPAVLAARKSAELFQAQKNEEGYKQAALLMESLVKTEQQKQETGSAQGDVLQEPAPAANNF